MVLDESEHRPGGFGGARGASGWHGKSQKAVGVCSGGDRGSSGLRRRNQRLSRWLQMSHKTAWVASEQPEVAPGG